MNRTSSALALFFALSSTAAFAVTLPNDNTNVTIDTSSLDNATLVASQSHPFSFVGSANIPGPNGSTNPYSFTGSFNEFVYRENATGTLDFAYNFTITSRTVSGPQISIPLGGIRQMTIVEYPNGITADVRNTTTGNSFYPTTANLFAPAVTLSNFVPNYFTARNSPNDTPPDVSTFTPRTFFIRTNALNYTTNGHVEVVYTYGFAAGDTRIYADAFAPTLAEFPPPVPEPMAVASLPLALAALGLRIRRK